MGTVVPPDYKRHNKRNNYTVINTTIIIINNSVTGTYHRLLGITAYYMALPVFCPAYYYCEAIFVWLSIINPELFLWLLVKCHFPHISHDYDWSHRLYVHAATVQLKYIESATHSNHSYTSTMSSLLVHKSCDSSGD